MIFPMPSGQDDAARKNNFNLLRFVAACLVIYSHAFLVTGQFKIEPLAVLVGFLDFGALGVKIFFIVSGFLITKSIFRQPSLQSFVFARALRIFPGLLVCALFCGLLIGPLCTVYPFRQYITDYHLFDFMWRLFTVHNLNNVLPGTFEQNPYAGQVNSPMWTLAAELICYFAILIWGLLRLLVQYRFKEAIAAIPVILAVCFFFSGIDYNDWYLSYVWSWGTMFLLGALCAGFASYIPLSLSLMVFNLLAAIMLFHFRSALFPAVFNGMLTYVVLVFAYHPRLQFRAFNKLGDFSFGLYIYAFPIQQMLVLKVPGLTPGKNFFLAFPIALTLSALSWYLVEKPALKLKSHA